MQLLLENGVFNEAIRIPVARINPGCLHVVYCNRKHLAFDCLLPGCSPIKASRAEAQVRGWYRLNVMDTGQETLEPRYSRLHIWANHSTV